MTACICGGVLEGFVFAIIAIFSWLIGRYTKKCNERCCKNKEAIDKTLKEYNKIGVKS